MHIYLQGLTMGLAYVAPIGLQNLFVINSALTQKRSRVYLTALIVIFFDITLGLACFLGAGALMQALPWLQKVILAAGSLIVIWIGIGLLRSKASLEGGRDVNVPVWKLITTACVVTWFNPQALIDDDARCVPRESARGDGSVFHLRLRLGVGVVVSRNLHGHLAARRAL